MRLFFQVKKTVASIPSLSPLLSLSPTHLTRRRPSTPPPPSSLLDLDPLTRREYPSSSSWLLRHIPAAAEEESGVELPFGGSRSHPSTRPETLSPRHGDRAQYPSPSCTRLVLGPWRSSCSHRIWGRRTLTTTTLLNLTAMIMLPRPPYGGVLFHSDDSHWWPRFCFLPDIRRHLGAREMVAGDI